MQEFPTHFPPSDLPLRKAITYGKLINGVDVCKFGKQWVVSIQAMKREYGEAGGTEHQIMPGKIVGQVLGRNSIPVPQEPLELVVVRR